jgi:hypothetical protein
MTHALVYARGDQTVAIRRCETGDGPLLFVMGSDHESRAYCFGDLTGLRRFQTRLEHFLVETGWHVQSLPLDAAIDDEDQEDEFDEAPATLIEARS